MGFFTAYWGGQENKMSFPLPWVVRVGKESDSLKYKFVFYFLSVNLLVP